MWSAWLCVKRIASTRRTSFARACARRSVDVSTSTKRTADATGDNASRPPVAASGSGSSRRMDGRVRRSCGSSERHTAQSQPIAGTPPDVPLPRTMTLRLNNPLPTPAGLDEAQAELIEHLLQELALLGGQIAAGLLLEQREDLNHLRGAV